MPTLLQAQQALEVAKATHKRSPSPTTTAAVTQAYDDLIEAYAADPNMGAQLAATVQAKVVHREKYEKVTTETPDKSERAEESESDSPPETQDSAAPSAEMPSEKPAKDKGKGPKGTGATDVDEQAIRGAYKAASGKYARELRGLGIDAYGAKFGPGALLRACERAFGVDTLGEIFGALAALPEQREQAKNLETRLAKLEGRSAKNDLEAIIGKAKLDGRTRGKEDRDELRAFGHEYGLKALQRRIADRPAKRTDAQGYHKPAEGSDGNRGEAGEMTAEEVTASHERVTRGMTAEEKAVYLEEFNKLQAKKRATAPAV